MRRHSLEPVLSPGRPPSRGLQRLVMGAVLLLLLAGGARLSSCTADDLRLALEGEGYVSWYRERWKAIQAARKHEVPLFALEVGDADDPRARDVTAKLGASEHRETIRMAVWLREETGEAGAAPRLLLYDWRDDGSEPLEVIEDLGDRSALELHAALRRFARDMDE